MGRELRRVPGDWQHPKTEQGLWIPMHEWWGRDEDAIAEGLREGYLDASLPYYGCLVMPEWPYSERTHVQYYESTTEGTPLSPVVATLEELAVWCFIDSKRSESWLHGVKIRQEDATLRDLDLDDWRSHVRGEWNEWYRRARTFAPYAHLKHPPGLELK